MTKSPFAGPFKMLRKELRQTQIDFAKRLGISQSLLSKIERGKLEPDARVYLKAFRFSFELSTRTSPSLLAFLRLTYQVPL